MSVKMPRIACFPINVKIWGFTQTLYLDSKTEVAIAHMNKGYQCSRHHHEKKWNRFHVVEGTLEIVVYRNDKEERVTLTRGMTLDIEPGLQHRMISRSDVDLIELYWVEEGEIDPSDIVRVDNGGIAE